MQPASRTRVTTGQVGASTWEVAVRAPHPGLTRYMGRLVGYAEHSPGPGVQRQLPQPGVTIILEFGPPLAVELRGRAPVAARGALGFVAGVTGAWATTRHEGVQRGIQVDLTPIGARHFFGVPMSELADLVVPLADVLPRSARELAEQLADAPSWQRRLDLVEDLFARRLVASKLETEAIEWAVSRIDASGGALDIGTLATELGCSHRHLIARFRDQVGVAPKLLARLTRFARVMDAVRAGVPGGWIELAADLGYSDQAHLARDVKHFSGLTPTEARAHYGPSAPRSELDAILS